MQPSTLTKQRGNPEEGPRVVPPRPAGPTPGRRWQGWVAKWSRWAHVYLSMVSFAVLFFFAATGLTLNHQQWFAKQQKTFQYKGSMDRKWLRSASAGGVEDRPGALRESRISHPATGA